MIHTLPKRDMAPYLCLLRAHSAFHTKSTTSEALYQLTLLFYILFDIENTNDLYSGFKLRRWLTLNVRRWLHISRKSKKFS